MDNKIAGSGVLRGANGQPLPPQYAGPKEPGPVVEVLVDVKVELANLQKSFADLTADHAALKAEHDETLKDVGAISDANLEFQNRNEALKRVNALAMDKIAAMEAEAQKAPESHPAEDAQVDAPAEETAAPESEG